MPQRVADVGGRNPGAGCARRVTVAANAPFAHRFQTKFVKKLSQQMSRIVDADASPLRCRLPDLAGSGLIEVEGNPLTACEIMC